MVVIVKRTMIITLTILTITILLLITVMIIKVVMVGIMSRGRRILSNNSNNDVSYDDKLHNNKTMTILILRITGTTAMQMR